MKQAETIQWRGRAVPALLPGVEFQEDGHIYKVNGEPWPSVTGFLPQSNFLGNSSDGANWGTSAHKHIFHLMKGTLDRSKVKENMEPTIGAWIREMYALKVKGADMLAEYIVYSQRYRFIGRMDFAFAVGTRDLVIDLKTGAPGELETLKTGQQLGGYIIAMIEHGLTTMARAKPIEINIQQDGTLRHREFDAREVTNVFLCRMVSENYYRKI